jgi:hypothetical protein
MSNPILLPLVQSRILLSLLLEDNLLSSSVMRKCRISGSTWKKESALLVASGLIGFEERKILGASGIVRGKSYFLTRKGKELAKQIRNVSDLIGEDLVIASLKASRTPRFMY